MVLIPGSWRTDRGLAGDDAQHIVQQTHDHQDVQKLEAQVVDIRPVENFATLEGFIKAAAIHKTFWRGG